MLKRLAAAATAVVCLIFFSNRAFGISANADAAIVIEAETRRVLFEQNADKELPMASTTKIMTALLALESEGLDDYFVVDPEAIRVEGSSMGLLEGDIVTLRALCYGMLLASGNDAANAAAVRVAGSIGEFVELMNLRAKQIGMMNTSFETPSGLDGREHYSTAYDMAILTAEALKNPDFTEIVAKKNAKIEYGNPPYPRWVSNHNRLIWEYEHAIGVKTGFTKKSGRCLVSAAERDGVRVICVTLNCPNDWNTHKTLLDYGLGELERCDLSELLPELNIDVAGGEYTRVKAVPGADASIALRRGEKERVQAQVICNKFCYAPVKAGDLVGEARFLLDGQCVLTLPIVVAGDVDMFEPEKPDSIWEQIKQFIKGIFGE